MQATKANSENSWSVKIADVNTTTYDLSVKNPNKKEETTLREPQEILEEMKALDAVYKQFQAIRLYYEFSDVDVDRYNVNGHKRQVMVSGREINMDNLPLQSQTFVNKRFQYTHGYGITMAEVNEFTPQGLPHLLIKDIPPISEDSSLQVKQPQIYFGEMTNSPVVVNSKEKEFDYPSGEDNVYTRYAGKGGVRLSN